MPFVKRERKYYKYDTENYTLPTMTSNTAPEGVVESNVSVSGAYADNPYSLFFNGKTDINAYANGSLRYIKYTFKNLLYPDTYTFNCSFGINSNVTVYKHQWEVIYEDDTAEEIVNDIDLEKNVTKVFTPTFTATKCIKAIKLNLHVYAPSDQNCYVSFGSLSLTAQGKDTNTVKIITNTSEVNLNGEDVWEDWKQPVLSSAGVLGGSNFAISSSSQYDSDHPNWGAFDGSDSSEWESSNSVKLPHWISWYNPNKLRISRLDLINGNNSYLTKAMLQGSNDYSKWNDIQEITNNVGTGGKWFADISSDTGYLYHRLYITGVSNNSYVDIAKIGITAQQLKAVGGTIEDADYYVDRNKLYQLVTKKRTYYKYGTKLNATVVGNFARINKGVASGFSKSQYLVLPNNFDVAGGRTWEMLYKFTTGSDVSTGQTLTGTNYYRFDPVCIFLEDAKFGLDFCSGTGTNIFSKTGAYKVLPNTDYWIKVSFDGSKYALAYSLDGVDYIEDISYATTKVVYSQPLTIGIQCASNNGSFSSPFLGTIDLYQSYININGERWWSGDSYTKVGSWIDEGVVSGFTSSNYTRLPFTFEGGYYNNWELVTKIKVNSYSSGPAILCVNSSYGIFNYAITTSGRVQLALSTSTDSFNICDDTGEKVLDLNTWYWYKAEFTGTAYNTYWSTDGKTWNLDSSVQKSTKLGSISALNFGVRTRNNDQILDGYIDMQETYFKANGVNVWHGTKVVSSTEADADYYTDNIINHSLITSETKYYKYTYQDFVQPILTADGALGGKSFACFAGTYAGNNPVYYAFDGSTTTAWCSNVLNTQDYIGFYNPKPLIVKNIKCTNYNWITGKWEVYGSNRNSGYELLATGTNTVNTNGSTIDMDLSSNNKAFKYYKIVCLTTLANQRVGMGEITITAQEQIPVESTSSDYDYYERKTKMY